MAHEEVFPPAQVHRTAGPIRQHPAARQKPPPARPARRRRGFRVAVAVAVLSLGGSGLAWAAARPGADPGFSSTIVALHSEKCLQTPVGRGSLVQQRTCNGLPGQTFTFAPARHHSYLIKAVTAEATVGCLDIRGAGRVNGAPLILWRRCHGGPNQRFQLHPVEGYPQAFTITAAHSRLCLDVFGGSPLDGARVVTWRCGNPQKAGNQVWRISGAPTSEDDGTATTTSASPTEATTTVAEDPSPTSATTGGSGDDTTTTTSGTAGTTTTAASSGSAPSPSAVEANPLWGKEPPPDDAELSRAYTLILERDPKGYTPQAGECSIAVHARYWTYGPDGLVYPTWHPRKGPGGCTFGHEHGDDPRTSALFATTGWPAFGYTNQQLAPSNPSSQRDEDHVGHKVSVGNDVEVHEGDRGFGGDGDGPLTMTCDSLMKFHQGTHSPDALVNNLHELLYHVRCTYDDDGSVIETRFAALVPLGRPGGFTALGRCSGQQNREIEDVGTPVPADSPRGLVARIIPDDACAAAVLSGDEDIRSLTEIWIAGISGRSRSPQMNVQIFPSFFVANPSRIFDPTEPDQIRRPIDMCYDGATGRACDQVRRATERNGGEEIAFDDPLSPFNGAQRVFAPGRFSVQNTGPRVWYTDAFASRFSTDPFPGAIQQYLYGNHEGGRDQGRIGGAFVNYAADATDRIHAPN